MDAIERWCGHKSRHDIQSKKLMFIIIWNSSCFYIVDRLPNHTKMKSAYSVTNIFLPLEYAIFPRGRAPHERRLVVHLDNCSVHTNRVSTDWLEEHSILRISHQSYSPDLASSDCYLFLSVKENLERIQLADEDKFLNAWKRFWGVSILTNWIPYFRLGCTEFKK
jgi:hypothetical protein